MRAAVMREGRLVVDGLPDPTPGPGQVLVRTLACGICGSDLHALRHTDALVEASRAVGAGELFDARRDVVLGHEFCAEVLDFGPNTLRRLAKGDRVCSLPILAHAGGVALLGFSNDFPGGYGELMLLTEPLLLRVPDGLPTEVAALTEPLAVGVHAVAMGRITPADAALVVGCGPVGLAVIAALRLAGVAPIVAADFSARRRAFALALGAHAVVDPAHEAPFATLRREAAARATVVFECVGVPGVMQTILRDAPRGARVVVAGACMEEDRIRPLFALQKELSLQFVFGYTPDEFARSLRALAEGEVDGASLVTGRVGLDGVEGAFDALARPDEHAKILVEPWRN